MVEHVNIADPDIHEPKGASTATVEHVYASDGAGSGNWQPAKVVGQATATAGQVFLADGLGGGVWVDNPQGWAIYEHSTTHDITTTTAQLDIDGLGVNSELSYRPQSMIDANTQFWDTTANRMTPVGLGDTYTVRLGLNVSAKTGNPSVLNLSFDIGVTDDVASILIAGHQNTLTLDIPFQISFTTNLYTLGTFLSNGCQILANVDVGSLTVDNPSIFIERNTDGSI